MITSKMIPLSDNIKKMITPNDNINDNTLNVIIFEGQNVIIFKSRGYYHFSGVNVIIFEGLDVIMLSFSSVEDVIIFHGVNVIILEVLYVIILEFLMLSF
jgi:hypothetical protein